MMIYKEKLKSLREEKNLTQKDLAEILDVHSTAYSQFEREYTIIPITKLNILCNYFHVSLDYMFMFSSTSNYKNNQNEINLDTSSKRLKEFRKENKITQTKLANFLNTTFSTVSAYERKRYVISTSYLYQICKKYKISADYLLGKTDEPKYL